MERTTLWNGIGIDVRNCNTTEEVMEKAGLDWTVSKKPLIWNGKSNRYYTITRDDNNDLLGVVKSGYVPVQNSEVFSFVDELIPEGVTYEKVGISKDGCKIWLLAKMPETTILGDSFDPYVVFMNTQDGTSSAKACMTPIRVACQNTLNLAFKKASRKWLFRHSNNINIKLDEAKKTFISASSYMDALSAEIEELAMIKVSPQKFNYLANELFPIKDNSTTKKQEEQMLLRDNLKQTYMSDDLGNLKGTAWGVLNAVSDLTTHRASTRKNNSNDTITNRMLTIAEFGEPILDRAYEILSK